MSQAIAAPEPKFLSHLFLRAFRTDVGGKQLSPFPSFPVFLETTTAVTQRPCERYDIMLNESYLSLLMSGGSDAAKTCYFGESPVYKGDAGGKFARDSHPCWRIRAGVLFVAGCVREETTRGVTQWWGAAERNGYDFLRGQ